VIFTILTDMPAQPTLPTASAGPLNTEDNSDLSSNYSVESEIFTLDDAYARATAKAKALDAQFGDVPEVLKPEVDDSDEYDLDEEETQILQFDAPFPYNAVYSTFDDALKAFRAFAQGAGFEEKGLTSRANVKYRECGKSGIVDTRNKANNIPTTKQRRRKSKKTDCPYKLKIYFSKDSNGWLIEDQCIHHNHGPDTAAALPAYRRQALTPEEIEEIVNWAQAGDAPKTIISHLLKAKSTCHLNSKDISNIIQENRAEMMGGRSPTQWLLYKLKEDGFHPKFTTNPAGNLTRIFFCHPNAVKLWRKNPDILILDATYKTNRFRMPLVNIGGVSNNNMTIQVALGFVSGEAEEDYNWVLGCLRHVMEKARIDEPRTIITDRQKSLINALVKVYPNSKHILCQWHVTQNVKLKTKRFFGEPIFNKQTGFHEPNPEHELFLNEWEELLRSPTRLNYNERLESFLYSSKWSAGALDYCKGWLRWAEKLVSLCVVVLPK
jgi:hypothetical protein